MSIKPVDFQLSVPRSVEVTKNKGDEQLKQLTDQQTQVTATHHQADNSVTQVNKREKPEEARIKEKEEREQQGKKKQHQENEKEENETMDKKEENKRREHIDVKI